jgi:hypothetical protein
MRQSKVANQHSALIGRKPSGAETSVNAGDILET